MITWKTFTDDERYLVSKVFQNYFNAGLYDIADEIPEAKSLFLKLDLIEKEDK